MISHENRLLQTILMIYHTLFLLKTRKDVTVVIGALRVKTLRYLSTAVLHSLINYFWVWIIIVALDEDTL